MWLKKYENNGAIIKKTKILKTFSRLGLFPEGYKLFAGAFHANLGETYADMVQFTKRWNWKWIV